MPWIARDKTGNNPYRIFGLKPSRLNMVSYDGDVLEDQYTWSMPKRYKKSYETTYGPLSNTENTTLDERDSPLELAPGEGPYEVKLMMVGDPPPRPFEGSEI